MELFPNQNQQQQDYAAWYTFVGKIRLKREAERKKAAKTDPKPVKAETSFLDAMLGWLVFAAVIYVVWSALRIYNYLLSLGASVLDSFSSVSPFL